MRLVPALLFLSVMSSFSLSRHVVTTYIRGTAFSVPVAALELAPGAHELTYGGIEPPLQLTLASDSATVLVPPPLRPQQSELVSLVHAIISTAAQRLQRPAYTVRVHGGDNNNDDVAVAVVDPTALAPDSTEWVDWMADDGATSLAVLPRPMVHTHNLLHRGIGVLILDSEGRVFVHQRSSTKRLFPSMYDMFVGGVSAAGEPPGTTLIRELQEEVGLDFARAPPPVPAPVTDPPGTGEGRVGRAPQPGGKRAAEQLVAAYQASAPSGDRLLHLGRTTIQTSYNHCQVECYAAQCSDALAAQVRFADGEVQWGEWVTAAALDEMLVARGGDFVPDGLQVWEAVMQMTR